MTAFSDDENLNFIKTHFEYILNPKLITKLKDNLIEGTSKLSSTRFYEFLKTFDQISNIEISKYTIIVLSYCIF